MKNIMRIVNQFRDAIDSAMDAAEFNGETPFCRFPSRCCGVASELLAHHLLMNGIRTQYVCGTYRDGSFENTQSHAWLLMDSQIIIDITGDQFRFNPIFLNYNKPVYIGTGDDFHMLFEVEDRDVHGNFDLDTRQKMLYRKIVKYVND